MVNMKKIKLQTIVIVLVLFVILRHFISSPYKSEKSEKAEKAEKAEAKKAAAGAGGTTRGKWVIVAVDGTQALYNKSITPSIFTRLPSSLYVFVIRERISIGNMFIDPGGRITKFDSSNNTWYDIPIEKPVTRLVPPAVIDLWTCAMGNTLISWCGTVMNYIPATGTSSESWTSQIQGPPVINTSQGWGVTIGNMVVTMKGEKVSSVVNGVWSNASNGPGAPSSDGEDMWRLSMGNVLISAFGNISKYTSTGWSIPSQALPSLNYNTNLPANSDARDRWICVVDDMIISQRGQICKYNTNGTFTTVTSPVLPVSNNPYGWDTEWVASMKLN